MSQFFFAVGPNGAGKSSLASALVPDNTVIIDGDEIRRQSKSLYEADAKTKSLIEGAIILRRPIYYESNFLDPKERDFYLTFREKKYKLNLIYYGLNSIEDSIQRVSKRTGLGGHTVPLTTIEMNFKHGIRNTIRNFNDFDSVIMVDNPISSENATKIIYCSEQKKEVLRSSHLPGWAEHLLHHVEHPLKPLPYADEFDEYLPRKR